MGSSNRSALLILFAGLVLVHPTLLNAGTRKGDKLIRQGRAAQLAEDWDKALAYYEQALLEDPSDPLYQAAVRRARFESAQLHIKRGRALREEGKLQEALEEFRQAFAIDPSSSIAEQELRRTWRMLKQAEEKAVPEEEKSLTEVERIERETQRRLSALAPPPELKPIGRQLNRIRIVNQPVRVLYETVGKLAGINVIFDPEFQAPPRNFSLDLTEATLGEALEHLAVLTRTYWKPLSENTIFVTNDTVPKRRDYEDMVVKVFYLKNITKVQELQEIVTAVRAITDIRRMFTYNSQNAILVRGTRDQVALAEKLIHDLDKPLPEVVVDVIVMEANRARTRELANALVSGGQTGLALPFVFTPRQGLSVPNQGQDNQQQSGSRTGVLLSQLGNLSTHDWSTTLPGALLQALLSDRSTRILQRPQVRAADGQKASLRLGDRVPYATGSFQPGIGAVGVSPLVSTQFSYAEVGVNLDITPKVHGEDEISLHVEIEISSVRERINIGGLDQPVIGQRRVVADLRVKEGEVTILGGLTQDQTTRTKNGIPLLSDIPIIKWLGFTSESKDRNESELLVALIPRLVRRPEIDPLNVRTIAAGTEQTVAVKVLPLEAEPQRKPEPERTSPAAQPSPAEPPAEAPGPQPSAPQRPSPAPTPQALRLQFIPPSLTLQPGQAAKVALVAENALDLFNAPMSFRFDPNVLRILEITRGSLLGMDGQPVMFTRNIRNEEGEASIIMNRLPGSGGINGSGTLIEIVVEAVRTGQTTLAITDANLRNSQLDAIETTLPALPVQVQ